LSARVITEFSGNQAERRMPSDVASAHAVSSTSEVQSV
jgi:hypothetical protein